VPIETSSDGNLRYYLIAFGANGIERGDDPDGLMSQRTIAALTEQPVTDVFVFSHGWQGDVSSARSQYGAWTAAMTNGNGPERMRQRRPGFLPLLVGLHWPSLPWGDEDLERPASFAVSETDSPVDQYAHRLADTPAAREALRVIFSAATVDPHPEHLPAEVQTAYATLDREAGLPGDGPDAAPGADREPFDAEEQYQTARREAGVPSFGIGDWLSAGVLTPLRTLSFWKMKDRGRVVGETGAHGLVRSLQQTRPEVRIHLMGHSFGCIVVSAALTGPAGGTGLPRAYSLVLVQGALSLWSCCSEIPFGRRRPGYFRRVAEGAVRGPIVTTQSSFDMAVGRWYPLAAGVARQVDFAPSEFPRYGGVGTFGLQGPGLEVADLSMLAANADYRFQPGKVYNLDGDAYIRNGGGFSGAHSDITGPEVAHVIWEAARSD
jgi:hypothetical protein